MNKTTLYKQLSVLTTSYFEITSLYFLDDLIEHHLNIEPNKLKSSELLAILDWLEIAAHLLLYDQKSAKSYVSKVRDLAENG